MIPKIIHYCWFGRKPLPKKAIKCINSWKKFFPEYKINEWNEENYDVKKIAYTAEAYDAGKFAFVSDYARFDILYHQGGIYFDTDVEVIKSFDDIILNGPFMGCEMDGRYGKTYHQTELNNEMGSMLGISVAPGLGIGVTPGLDIFKEILDYYYSQHFLNSDGSYNTETVVKKITHILKSHGLKEIKGIQTVAGIAIYPREYFNPLQDSTGVLNITENTHSIHWYAKSWIDPRSRLRSKLTRPFHRLFGDDCFERFRR